METTNIIDFARRDGMTDALTELLRTGAQELIATAVEAELASYLAQFADVRTDAGHAAVVRNGHHPERPFQTSIVPVRVVPDEYEPFSVRTVRLVRICLTPPPIYSIQLDIVT